MNFADLPVNPFSDKWVNDPRRAERPVPGLNNRPLARITAAFRPLDTGAPPRPQNHPIAAQFLQSENPGYGKSHLLGRLFRELGSRATRVYVRPFGAPSTSYQTLLRTIVGELVMPESSDALACRPGELDQLDVFARCVISRLLAQTIEADRKRFVRALHLLPALKDEPLKLTEHLPQSSWQEIRQSRDFEDLINRAAASVAQYGITLSPEVSPRSWVCALFSYTLQPDNHAQRQLALEWIKAKPLDDHDIAHLGVRKADSPRHDLPLDDLNEFCRQRVKDLCRLAAFHRPFLLCFDQTEVFGQTPELSRTLGRIIADLVSDTPHTLTIVTGNKDIWDRSIRPNIEQADWQRFSQPLELEGLDRSQAASWVRLRLGDAGLAEEEINRFLDGKWLDETFRNSPQLGARDFLSRCETRWEQPLSNQPVGPPLIPPGETPPAPTLEDLFAGKRAELRSDPRQVRHNADILEWLVSKVAAPQQCNPTRTQQFGHPFTILWRMPNRQTLFGFEDGCHHSTWRSIKNKAVAAHTAGGRPTRIVMLRFPELDEIPRKTWTTIGPEILETMQSCLTIQRLSRDEAFDIMAAWNLFSAAVAGDIPPWTGDQAMEFVRQRLEPFWSGFAELHGLHTQKTEEEVRPQPDQGQIAPLFEAIEGEVRRGLMVSDRQLAKALAKVFSREVSLDEMLAAASASKHIHVFAHPKAAVFQWRQ